MGLGNTGRRGMGSPKVQHVDSEGHSPVILMTFRRWCSSARPHFLVDTSRGSCLSIIICHLYSIGISISSSFTCQTPFPYVYEPILDLRNSR